MLDKDKLVFKTTLFVSLLSPILVSLYLSWNFREFLISEIISLLLGLAIHVTRPRKCPNCKTWMSRKISPKELIVIFYCDECKHEINTSVSLDGGNS